MREAVSLLSLRLLPVLLVLISFTSVCGVNLGLLFPLTNHPAGGQRAAAAILAARHITTRSDPLGILGGATLRGDTVVAYTLRDTASSQRTAMTATLDVIQSNKVHGLVGAASSSVSSSIQYLAAALKVPQISYSSTSASLSNKGEFPYFLRTVPPDTLQADGLVALVKQLGWTKLSVLGENNVYGTGLLAGVVNAAQNHGIGIAFTSTFTLSNLDSVLDTVRTAGSRIIVVAAGSSMVATLFEKIAEKGMAAPEFQWLGTDGIMQQLGTTSDTVRKAIIGTVGIIPDGGEGSAKYQSFIQQWNTLKAADFPEVVADGQVRVRDDEFLNTPNTFSPFAYDAVWAYALASDALATAGGDVSDGSALLGALKQVSFTGVTGSVSFNSNGDRLAPYRIVNFQPGGTLQQTASYSAQAGIAITSPIHWGTVNNTLPEDSQCPTGFRLVGAKCVACPAGQFSNSSNAQNCTLCPLGTFSPSTGSPTCIPCPVGHFQDRLGQSQCERCGIEAYNEIVGSPSCMRCPEGSQSFFAAANRSDCRCQFGFYALDANFSECSACPAGAQCPGGFSLVTEPGFYRSPDAPAAFNECEPPEACLGGMPQVCKSGYLGKNCGDCDIENFYYRLGTACSECGSAGAYVTLFVFLCIIPVFFVFFLLWASAAGFNNSSLNVLLDFFQVLAVFGEFRLNWPASIKAILVLSSLSNFNIDLFRIECNVVVMHHYTRWIIWMFLPFLLGLFMIVIYVAGKIIRITPWFKELFRPSTSFLVEFLSLNRHDLHRVWGGAIVRMMVIAYVMVLERVFSHFTCTRQNDDTWVMESNRSLVCYDRTWQLMLIPALTCILLYCVILPGYFFYKLKTNIRNVSRDFSIVFRALYDDYAGRTWWWEICIMVRILLVLFTAGAVTSASLQTSALLFIQFGFVMICVYTRPYVVRRVNTIQVTAECCLFATLMSGLMWTKGDHDNSTKVLIEVIMIIFILCVLGVTIPSVFREMIAFHKSKALDPIFAYDQKTREYSIHWNPESAALQFAKKQRRRRTSSAISELTDLTDLQSTRDGDESSPSPPSRRRKDVDTVKPAPELRLRSSSTTGTYDDIYSSEWGHERYYGGRSRSYSDANSFSGEHRSGLSYDYDETSSAGKPSPALHRNRTVSWSDLPATDAALRDRALSGTSDEAPTQSNTTVTKMSSADAPTSDDDGDVGRTYSFTFGADD